MDKDLDYNNQVHHLIDSINKNISNIDISKTGARLFLCNTNNKIIEITFCLYDIDYMICIMYYEGNNLNHDNSFWFKFYNDFVFRLIAGITGECFDDEGNQLSFHSIRDLLLKIN